MMINLLHEKITYRFVSGFHYGFVFKSFYDPFSLLLDLVNELMALLYFKTHNYIYKLITVAILKINVGTFAQFLKHNFFKFQFNFPILELNYLKFLKKQNEVCYKFNIDIEKLYDKCALH